MRRAPTIAAGLVTLALPLVLSAGCSLLFDGSPYRGGAPGDDGGRDAAPDGTDGGGDGGDESDGGGGSDGGGDDGGGGTCPDTPCEGAGSVCVDGACVDCDGDDDGYYADTAGCEEAAPGPVDCDDADPSIHPNALPVCGDGIDQGCLGDNPAFFGLADEFGQYEAHEVRVQSGAPQRPQQLRVFLVGDAHALVLYQHGDSRRTPHFADVQLDGDPTTVVPALTVEGSASQTVSNEPLRADAIRGPDRRVRFGVVGGDAGGFQVAFFEPTTSGGATSWSLSGSRMVSANDDLGVPDFTATGSAAIIAHPEGDMMALAGTATPDGMVAMGLATAQTAQVSGLVDPSPRWLTSAGTGVVAPGRMGLLRFWPGQITATVEETVRVNVDPLPTPIAARPTATMARGAGGEGLQLVTFLPGTDRIQAFGVQCTAGGPPLSSCTAFTEVPAPPPYVTTLASPVIASSLVSASAIILVYPGATDDAPFRLANFETDTGFPTELAPVDAAAAGVGTVREISVDTAVSPTSPDTGEVTVSYAYLREDAVAGRRIYVSGFRGCIGYDGK